MCANVPIIRTITPPPPTFSSINSNREQIESSNNKNPSVEKTVTTSTLLSVESYDRAKETYTFSRKFSCSERVLRILLGSTLVILTLGISLIFKPTRQLFYKNLASVKLVKPVSLSKATRTLKESSISLHTFQEIDQVELQQTISDNIDDIKKKNITSKNIKIFAPWDHVFSLLTFLGWIFKTSIDNSEQIIQRSAYTEKIRQVCKKNNFDHLVILESHLIKVKIDGKPVLIIVERMLDIESNPSLQENLYMQHHNEYTLALQQLVHLICQTDLKDIKWENCPLLFDNSTNSFSKIALIDLEPWDRPKDDGLFGCLFWNTRGIIRCVPSEHFPTIKSIISNYDKSLTEYQKCVQKRLEEIQTNQQLAKCCQDE